MTARLWMPLPERGQEARWWRERIGEGNFFRRSILTAEQLAPYPDLAPGLAGLGQRMRALREWRGLAHQDLVDNTNGRLHAWRLRLWESGVGVPEGEDLRLLARVLGTEVETLTGAGL